MVVFLVGTTPMAVMAVLDTDAVGKPTDILGLKPPSLRAAFGEQAGRPPGGQND
jgi:hypothetical protein